MSKIILILGGARSGKSTYAASLAQKYKKVAFIATGEALDKEMEERIRLHRKARPGNWKTFEEAKDPTFLLTKIGNDFDCVIIDCITLLVSNLILCGYKEDEIMERIGALLTNLRKKKTNAIIVSNEVGLGIVPTTKLGRDFRDIAGKVNQIVAKVADEVFFLICGIPIMIKGEK